MFEPLHTTLEQAGGWTPLLYLFLFLDASFLMIWRQNALARKGMEGTALGTLIMPYCSGLGNLLFVFVMLKHRDAGGEVLVNSIVNNVTNLTLLIGLPTLIWGMSVIPVGKIKAREAVEHHVNRLSLLVTLIAVFFFTGAVWMLARDGELNRGDGMTLIALFLFWQATQVFDVMKSNARKNTSLPRSIALDLLLIGLGGAISYFAIEGLVEWLMKARTGFLNAGNLGWLSGWLMVLPNALMAFYYAWKKQPDVVYSSQVGDGHICIPLCVGLYATFEPMEATRMLQTGCLVIGAAAATHFVCVATMGRLPRWLGALLSLAYAGFVYSGLIR
jgi:cation:H+ antiporter